MKTIETQPLLGLRQIRADRHLSLRDVAAISGVSAMTLSCWERATHQPHPLMLQAVAQSLGVTVEDLVGDSRRYDNPLVAHVSHLDNSRKRGS